MEDKEQEFVLTADELKKFQKDGFVVVPDFLTASEVDSLITACRRLVDEMDHTEHDITIFSTDDEPKNRNKYFLESGDKIRFFFEAEAVDDRGNLKTSKHFALNKIGHALHWLGPEFRKVSFSEKVKTLARQLNFQSPALVQSMYIFKQPGFGGEVTPHKDSTFLSTTPQSCVGLWMALEDASESNGCLWFSPGSHKSPTERRFIRNPTDDGPLLIFTQPPDPDDPSKYVAVPVKKGSMVVIDGQVDHKSAQNLSQSSRHIYTFHIIERKDVVWDPRNWLQPTQELPFTGLYENTAM